MTRQDETTGDRVATATDRSRVEDVGPSSLPCVADVIAGFVGTQFPSGLPVRLRFWDGSELGPSEGAGTVAIHSPQLLRRLIWSPDELGIARGFVAGEIEFEGDAFALLRALHDGVGGPIRSGPRALAQAARVAWRLGVLGPPPPRPAEEIRLSGATHSKKRDSAAISHHYDVGNAFYRLVLGPSMTYSCARFDTAETTLEAAQASKHEMICRKLGLHERSGARLLDVGCGWGSMALHAAANYGSRVVGITLSTQQAEAARARVAGAGLERAVEIRVQDYRDLGGESFDAISSIGMFEHVGRKKMAAYFATLMGVLAPEGRLLNHAISSPGGSRLQGRTFMNRYVFPDGELIDVAEVLAAMEQAGFEVRDMESLREHYSRTLHAWVDNLAAGWDAAVAQVGAARARVWWLYMAASANGFDAGDLAVHQVLGVAPGPRGESGMAPTRQSWT